LDRIHQLIQRTVSGDSEAWRSLQLELAPQITNIARAHRSMRVKGLARLPDDVAEVATLTLERLARDSYDNLRTYLARAAEPSAPPFDNWLYGAVDFSVRSHLRARFGRAPSRAEPSAALPNKRDVNTNADRLDQDADAFPLYAEDVASRLAVAEIMSHVEAHFVSYEVEALRMYYLEDEEFDAIATVLKLRSEKDAANLIRRLNARLRYHFMTSRAANSG
jgi:hypothetical protein